jgi:hypothetical protein
MALTVLLASPRSFCAGVERAIAVVEQLLEQRYFCSLELRSASFTLRQARHKHMRHRWSARGEARCDARILGSASDQPLRTRQPQRF